MRRQRKWCSAAAAMTAALLLAACGGSVSRFETADDLARALVAADVECSGLADKPPATLVNSGATCQSGRSALGLYVFDTTDKRDQWLLVGGRLGPVAVGPNWAIAGDPDGTRSAAAALNADWEETDSV
jgi:hypothetical protein